MRVIGSSGGGGLQKFTGITASYGSYPPGVVYRTAMGGGAVIVDKFGRIEKVETTSASKT
jgi:hypothetical protein